MGGFKTRIGAVASCSALLGSFVMAGTATAAPFHTKTLPDTVPSWATASALHGSVPASDHVGFRVYLGWRSDPSALDRAVSTPGSPQYGQYLSPAQFRAQYAPSQSQVTAVQQWLRGQGFTIDYTPANNLYVAAEGTVTQAESAFGATLGEYSYQGLTLRAPEKALSVPSSLMIQSVVGLDDSAALVHTDHITSDATPSPAFLNGGPCSKYWGQDTTAETDEPTPLVTSDTTITSPGSVALPGAYGKQATPFAPCGYTPAQLRGAYGLSTAQNGAGQTVAIIDAYASPTIVEDANAYFSAHNVPDGSGGNLIPSLDSTNFTQVVAPGTYKHPEEGVMQDPSGWYGEETLDVEAMHTMAPDAHIVFVGSPNSFQDMDAAMNDVVDRHLASMVSNSYGWGGEAVPKGVIIPMYDIMQQAVAEGIGLYFSSGDSGDETGGSGNQAQATPDWPASSPLVTAVGGTSLAVGSSSTDLTSWQGEWGWETGESGLSGTNTSNLSWSPKPPGTYVYGSGGGTSRIFAQPWYQAGVVPASMATANGGSTPMRVVPDVSALADPTTGMLIGQTQTFPDGSAKYSEYRIGGTSLASPLFTGMMADVQADRGTTVGFANPYLYGLSTTDSTSGGALRDITPVNPTQPPALVRSDYANYVDASDGYRASIRSIDFDAPLTIHVANGYDDVTGIGSPDGSAFFPAP